MSHFTRFLKARARRRLVTYIDRRHRKLAWLRPRTVTVAAENLRHGGSLGGRVLRDRRDSVGALYEAIAKVRATLQLAL